MRPATLLLAAAIASSACAVRPEHHTEVSQGRIVERSDHDGGPSGPVVRPLAVPAGNVTIHFTTGPDRGSSPYFIYRIRLASGRMLQTQSTAPFNPGDCVRLWHPPLGVHGINDFVSGTLESSVGCR
jgi:hypothetical protein